MAFDQVNVRTARSARDYGRVQIALYRTQRTERTNGKEYVSCNIEVTVDEEIYSRLGWEPGKTRLLILEGHGPDEGMLQFRPADNGTEGAALTGRETVKGRQSGVVRVNTTKLQHHKPRESTVRALPATFQAFGSALTVVITDVVAP